MTPAALEAHYTEVADKSPVPVVLYSVPANTSLDLPLASVVRLASHPNIIGIKDSGGDITKLAAMVALTQDTEFQVIAGSASFLLAALTVGSVGGICALANVLPGPVCDLVSLHRDNKTLEARRLQVLVRYLGIFEQYLLIFAASAPRAKHRGDPTVWCPGPQAGDGLVWVLRRPHTPASAASQRGAGRGPQEYFQDIWL